LPAAEPELIGGFGEIFLEKDGGILIIIGKSNGSSKHKAIEI